MNSSGWSAMKIELKDKALQREAVCDEKKSKHLACTIAPTILRTSCEILGNSVDGPKT